MSSSERTLTISRAMSEAIAQEMRTDPNVFVMGEDVGVYGGIFGSTAGLYDEFGAQRVIDTPISRPGSWARRWAPPCPACGRSQS